MGFETGKAKVEARFKDENGDYHWFEIKGKLFIDFDGKKKGLTISRDITEHKQLENDLKNTIKKLDILNQIILSGNQAKDLACLLEKLLNSTLELMDFEGGGIYLVEETTGIAEIVYHKGLPLDFIEQIRNVNINEGNYRKVFLDGKPIFTDNYFQINPERAKQWNILSIASIPLFSKSKVIGALNIASKSRNSFSIAEKKLLQTIGRETGTVIAKMLAEQNLKESEEKYRYLFNNAQVGLYWSSISDGNIFECNNIFAKLFGYDTREECLANYNAIERYIDPNARNEMLEEIRDNKEVKNYEIHVTKRDDTPIWLSISARMFEKENRIEGAAIDITARKKTEQELKENTEFIQNVFIAIQDGLSVLDLDLNIVKVNPFIIEKYGSINQIINRKCYDVYQKRTSPCPWCPSIKTIETGHLNTSIVPYPSSENPTGWIELTAFPIKNSDGIVEGIIEYVKDITERKKAEEKLQLERDNFLNILNSMQDGVYIVDQNYDIEYANPSLTKEFGQFEGMKCFKYFEDLNEICPKCKNKDVFQGKTIKGEWFSFKNQKTYDVIDTPLKNPDGSISKLGIFRDETEKKQVEKKIKKSEENYRVLFENSPISLWEEDFSELKNYIEILKNSGIKDFRVYFDKNPEEVKKCLSMIKIVDINKKTVEFYKANKKEDFFVGLDNVFTEESLDTFKEIIISLAGGKTRFESETINCTFNGDKLFIFLVCEIVAGFKEDWSKALISIVDISERKKAEQKLIESEEKFRTIAERTLMGIIIVQDNQFKYINDALLNMFEYSKEEVLNWKKGDLTKLIHPDELLFLREYREHLRSGDKSFKPFYSYRVFTKSGKMKWIDQFSKEILFKGRPAELVTIIDITEKKEAEQELIKLNNLKSELLRRSSHELRTPLVSIKGFSDLLLELHKDKLDDYVIKTIKQIRMGCNRLESLVNDILKTAELESGTVELKKSKEDLSLLIKRCVSEFGGLRELRNHSINLEILDEEICSFEKKKIYNVITNILSNAIKFTPSNGKIEVKSEINNGFIIISIKDNGIGFTEEERSLIFKRFGKIERYGQGYDVISEGSGLGLYISKKIVELHGGKIWLESEGRNKGSTLYFSLPII
jgi:PAS domain S-box-containing protein